MSIWIVCCGCEIRKIRIVCSVFELCAGSSRFRVEAVDVHNAQVLAMEVVLAKVLSEATTQCHIFGWCFWFVWLVCWSVCCVTGDVGDELISHSFVAEWREKTIFGLFLWGVCSQWEWQVSPNARPLSRSVLAFWLFFRFYELIMFLARCRFFVLVRSTPCVNDQFIQHFFVEGYVTRSSSVRLFATSSECEVAECNRASASCRSCLFNEVLWRRRSMFDGVGVGVSTKRHCVSCHARRH